MINGIEKIAFPIRINEIQQRITAIEDKFSGNNFQVTLEREIARQAEVVQSMPKLPTVTDLKPVNENEIINANKIAEALNAQTPPEIQDIPEVAHFVQPPVENNFVYDDYDDYGDDFIYDDYVDDTEYFNFEEIAPARVNNYRVETTEDIIRAAARKYGVESDLVKAIGTAESNLNQNAISNVGAIGVMQLMPETAAGLGVNPYDERQNIYGGAHYIRQMLDTFNGNLPKAIAAYNAGPGAVQKYGGVPPYSETQNYVGRVMDFYVR